MKYYIITNDEGAIKTDGGETGRAPENVAATNKAQS